MKERQLWHGVLTNTTQSYGDNFSGLGNIPFVGVL